jgi:hypothetical protein
MEQEDKLKKLFGLIQSDEVLGKGYKGVNYDDFKKLAAENVEFRDALHKEVTSRSIIDPAMPFADFDKKTRDYALGVQPQTPQPPPISLAPPQQQSRPVGVLAPPSLTERTAQQAVQPMQATGQPQTGQIIELTGEPQTGEFRAEIVNGKKVYMPQGITAGGEEFIDEGTDVSKDPTGQYQSTGVLIDDRGQTLNEELQNIVTGTPKDKQGLAYQNAQNVKNDAKSTWQRLKETGSGLLTSAKTQADAAMGFLDTVLNPMSFIPGASKPVSQGGFGGETNLAKGAKKEFIRTALEGEKELNAKIQELGLQTDIVDAVKSGRGSDIIQAINHNIGQMAYQVPLSISTFGASSFAMEGAEAYKGIVDAQAKELGITADELIERGLDKQALGIGVGAISGAVDYLGAKSLASFINAGGAYEQLAKAIASKLPKKYGTGFLTRAAVASNAEGFQESIQEGVKLGGERIASGKWDPNALNRLGKSYANAAVGAGGTYVGGRTVNAALNPSESITLNTFNNAPVIGQAPRQGGFDAVILADQINQGKKVDIQSALAADAYLDSEIQRQGENVSPELLEHKKTISEFIDKENEFAPRRQARKDVLPDGSVLYFVGSEAEVPEEFKDRAKPSTSTRDGKPVGSFSFTLTPEEDAAYQQGMPPPSGAEQTTYVAVSPEELQAFQQGQIDPERAAAIADDVALIQSGQMDINSIDDANYRVMVESALGANTGVDGGGVEVEQTKLQKSIDAINRNREAELTDAANARVIYTQEFTDEEKAQRRQAAIDEIHARYDGIIEKVIQRNETPILAAENQLVDEQLPLADQAQQNLAPAANPTLETGAAPVAVGESGRPVVEGEDVSAKVVEEEGVKPVYPIEKEGKWYGEGDYKSKGGKLVEMTPDEFLSKAKPLEIDDAARDNIDDLKEHIKSGRKLDPLTLYSTDKSNVRNSDGRHRAIAAKELGISTVPVVDYTKAEQAKPATQQTPADQITTLRAKEQAEYDAMSDPNDKAKRDEIYDKYDELITPLLREQKALEPTKKAQEGKVEQDYQEAISKKSERAKNNAKEKFINDNFDKIVSQLMLENKIKRKC